jgi:hypothetical protein
LRIEDECFAVSPALAWRHFVAIPPHDIGDGNFTKTFVRGWDALTIRLKLLLVAQATASDFSRKERVTLGRLLRHT